MEPVYRQGPGGSEEREAGPAGRRVPAPALPAVNAPDGTELEAAPEIVVVAREVGIALLLARDQLAQGREHRLRVTSTLRRERRLQPAGTRDHGRRLDDGGGGRGPDPRLRDNRRR